MNESGLGIVEASYCIANCSVMLIYTAMLIYSHHRRGAGLPPLEGRLVFSPSIPPSPQRVRRLHMRLGFCVFGASRGPKDMWPLPTS